MAERKMKNWYAGLPKEVFGLEWFRILGLGEAFYYFYIEAKIFAPVDTADVVNAIVKYLQKIKYGSTFVEGIWRILEEDELKNIYPRNPAGFPAYALTKIALKKYRYLVFNKGKGTKCTGEHRQKRGKK